MNIITYLVYVLVLGLIRFYKAIELGILILATPLIRRLCIVKAREVDISLHNKQVLPDLSIGEEDFPATNPILGRASSRKHLDLIVHDNRFYARFINTGHLAMGEGFMKKSWDIPNENWEDLTETVCRVIEHGGQRIFYRLLINELIYRLKFEAFNMQSRDWSFRVGKAHYDLGNDLYETMLDPWMQYTCAYWKKATNLNDAQVDKMEMICKKLELQPGMTVLDMGCGWGTLAKYMAEKYHVKVVGVTIGREGAAYGQHVCEGLSVDIRVQDYRDVKGKFDRIVCVGIMEHIGHLNYKNFFKKASILLEDNGILLVHTIGRRSDPGFSIRADPWLLKYIFPNSMVPFQSDITDGVKGLFVIEDWHGFGLDYAKTLHSWRENFLHGWPQLEKKYGDLFFRMWIYYLSSCRAVFLVGEANLWQVVLSKGGLKRDYRAYR